MKNIGKREYEDWLELCERIKNQTAPIASEDEKDKKSRIQKLLNDFEAFCLYYFPHYCSSRLGWFHLEASKKITKDKKIFAVLEWPREHAKSVFADVFMPLWLKAKGELSGMILVSGNEQKAAGLLGDIQAELVNNQRYIADFGEQTGRGSWQDGQFSTKDGIGFWAFGRGQNPRGARKAAKRPNYAVVDDIDDKVIVKNPQRVREAVAWVMEDLYGCLAITGGRVVIAGNRIHKGSILAHIVGDIEPDDPKNEGITHIKVFAFEKGPKHEKAMPGEKGAAPAWKENHKTEDLKDKFQKMGFRSAMREFFHEHHEEGLIFKDEWIEWVTPLAYKDYDGIVVYCDPSFKHSKTSDHKAIVAVGRKGNKYHILKAWVRVASIKSMVVAFYDFFAEFGKKAKYYMEANMLQDLLLSDFDTEAEHRDQPLPLRPDKQHKENKEMRIENMSPLFERGNVLFNEQERKNPDMQKLKDQLLGFGSGEADDGPDALEGAISKLHKKNAGHAVSDSQRTGKYSYNSKRKY